MTNIRLVFCGLALALGAHVAGAGDGFTLTPDVAGPQPVGTTVTWTIGGEGVGNVLTRISVQRISHSEPQTIIYDYLQRDQYQWTPMKEGTYRIVANVRDSGALTNTRLSQVIRIASLPGAAQSPRVSPTRHPLVALYSSPECAIGRALRVTFQRAAPGSRTYTTDAKPCASGETVNVYIAGMRELSTYRMRHEILNANGDVIVTGPVRSFTTGAIDGVVAEPTIAVPAAPGASTEDPVVLACPTGGQGVVATAADTEGEIIWYYAKPDDVGDMTLVRWNDGGTYMMHGTSDALDRWRMREADLAGNTIRETSARRVSEMLENNGRQWISQMHHEVRILPNGHIAMLGHVERIMEDVQGPGEINVLADNIITLDENMQFAWETNFFNLLDITRLATGGETCGEGIGGCPLLLLSETANDWTHANAIGYSPSDGNLIASLRHQDYSIKVDYRDGIGTGALVWRLGKDGDFTAEGFPPEIDPWFTHQHDTNYVGDNGFIVYDNGNLNEACVANPDDCVSRGQVWTLDEDNMTATLDTNADLVDYSFAVGAASVMKNGNYNFNNGFPAGPAVSLSRQDEVLADGTRVFAMEFNARAYRGYRLPDMYTANSYDEPMN